MISKSKEISTYLCIYTRAHRNHEGDEKITRFDPPKEEYTEEDISMDLTVCGMNIERTEKIVHLYAEHLEWEKVKEIWHEERLGDRGSRDSSQKVFNVIRKRLQSGNDYLPPIKHLSEILEACEKEREKAQVLYFYILEKEGLVRYIVKKSFPDNEKETKLDFSNKRLQEILKGFRFDNGDKLSYSENTLARWFRGFRTLMRDIGVISNKQNVEGEPPLIGSVPLQVSSGYSWRKMGKDWLETPIGWMNLFQLKENWKDLSSRLSDYDNWEFYEVQGKQRMKPKQNPFKIGEIDGA